MGRFLTTREVAEFLSVNEKMVYGLISEKDLPATKVTGKWLFPQNLVIQWIESNTINYPKSVQRQNLSPSLLVIVGSGDVLLEKAISLYNAHHPDHLAILGNEGGMGGLQALRRNLCHIASSHAIPEDGSDDPLEGSFQDLDQRPAVVNFCRREQGILVPRGNPKKILTIPNLAESRARIVNRTLGTGTRRLLDRELKKAGIPGEKIDGYHNTVPRQMDVGIEVLTGRADAGLGVRAVAAQLQLGFIPLCWERYDLMIFKERFFSDIVQRFLSFLHTSEFHSMASLLKGYDLSMSGRMLFQTAECRKACA